MKAYRFLVFLVVVTIITLSILWQIERVRVDRTLALIDSVPSWIEIAPDDEDSRTRVMISLEELRRTNIATLRRAVARYLEKGGAEDELQRGARVYALNRYLFAVPEWVVSKENVGFGGWLGVPVRDDTRNELWPLSFDQGGRLQLTGVFRGYLGAGYMGITEFDHFRTKYGLRRE
jgi:hypothetical protein